MADKTLVMTFLNQEGSRASITLPGIRDNVTEAEVSAAMDVVVAKNIFYSTGGDLVTKHSVQLTDRNAIVLVIR